MESGLAVPGHIATQLQILATLVITERAAVIEKSTPTYYYPN
jgi:hypothetical protein